MNKLITEKSLIGAIDQGTSSSRFLIFDSKTTGLITYHQVPINSIHPQEGWVEQDPLSILKSVEICIEKAVENLKSLNICPSCIKAIGITNQRESTICWNRKTGVPLANAIIWLDVRTADTVNKLLLEMPNRDKNHFKPRCGLPLSTYFSSTKMRWLIDNCENVRDAIKENTCCFGTVDTWLLWNLTGGIHNGCFKTDVTNASRTMLMNIHDLKWDPILASFFKIPLTLLPEICSSSEIYGYVSNGPLIGTPISGILGDQQASLVGHNCLQKGQTKNTYGTGCFVLCNTGTQVIESSHGLLSTVAYQMGKNKPVYYALEGSIAIAGAAIMWLKENLNIINEMKEIETLAASVPDTHGCYFVPAFSGLFCPYWQSEARGVICGLAQSTTRAHLARASLEAVCFQTKEVINAFELDLNFSVKLLRVDGGMTNDDLLLQIQADILGTDIVRPTMHELTSLGAAIAAGQAEGINLLELNSLEKHETSCDIFKPSLSIEEQKLRFSWWKKAVFRSMDWTTTPNNFDKDSKSSLAFGLYIIKTFTIFVLSNLIIQDLTKSK